LHVALEELGVDMYLLLEIAPLKQRVHSLYYVFILGRLIRFGGEKTKILTLSYLDTRINVQMPGFWSYV